MAFVCSEFLHTLVEHIPFYTYICIHFLLLSYIPNLHLKECTTLFPHNMAIPKKSFLIYQ